MEKKLGSNSWGEIGKGKGRTGIPIESPNSNPSSQGWEKLFFVQDFKRNPPKIRMKRSRGGYCRGSCGSYCLLTREGEEDAKVVACAAAVSSVATVHN
uniref:Uncharacterized protein n=1 Tax=Solanum tuberosum TaxID=4113 RepID=M1BVF3_SOLTU